MVFYRLVMSGGIANTKPRRPVCERGNPGPPHDLWAFVVVRQLERSAWGSMASVHQDRHPIDRGAGEGKQITCHTSDIRSAGTDADVSITLVGGAGTLGPKVLQHSNSNLFERGVKDEFLLEGTFLGDINRIEIGHNNKGFGAGWHLDRVEVSDENHNRSYHFPCKQWFDSSRGDKKVMRTITAAQLARADSKNTCTYKVKVYTGDMRSAGTDASVFIIFHGSRIPASAKKNLESQGKDLFERGQVDEFMFEFDDVGDVNTITVGHDNRGLGAGWFLNHVEVTVLGKQPTQYFVCRQWLDKKKGDFLIERTIQASAFLPDDGQCQYKVVVTTGDHRGAGTDATVRVVIYGDKGQTALIPLISDSKNLFERAQVDEFLVQGANVGNITRLQIGHDNKGWWANWHCKQVEVTSLANKQEVKFFCDQWFDKKKGDGQIIRELTPLVGGGQQQAALQKYTVTTHTADVRGAGTDADVYITLVGTTSRVGPRFLVPPSGDPFERGQADSFTFEAGDVGAVTQIIIGHNNKGWGAAWMLDFVEVVAQSTQQTVFFPSKQWFDAKQGDRKIERTIDAVSNKPNAGKTSYKLEVHTSDLKNAGTDANVSVVVFGNKGMSGPRPLPAGKEAFERGSVDYFVIETDNDLGELERLQIGHDDKGWFAGWHLSHVEVTSMTTNQTWLFPCQKWMDKKKEDKMIQRMLTVGQLSAAAPSQPPPEQQQQQQQPPAPAPASAPAPAPAPPLLLPPRRSRHHVKNAGTDSNVSVKLFGENGQEGPAKQLIAKRGQLERGNNDNFTINTVDVGRPARLQIGHDNTGFGPGWHLSHVTVTRVESGEEATFICQQWLDKTEGDKLTTRILTASSTAPLGAPSTKKELPANEAPPAASGAARREVSYTLRFETSSRPFAGTDSQVWFELVGTEGTSGIVKPDQKPEHFDRACKDTFTFQLPHCGDLNSLKLGTDKAGKGPDWHLSKVVVNDGASGREYIFSCGEWFDKKRGYDKTLSVSQ
ncbi:hypothetical protein CYMTET_37584 [Cymbomonas tetramitiformis]|uniref:PLAT domain-containing protein n=1 Tax=Cymbomonas tetramitiformis TaxID=36881 RepID=A0AAE0CDL9_9CHLO|nr:hypothetical protein CYMTET_37584 [Cymbomonas tetramitiformis]